MPVHLTNMLREIDTRGCCSYDRYMCEIVHRYRFISPINVVKDVAIETYLFEQHVHRNLYNNLLFLGQSYEMRTDTSLTNTLRTVDTISCCSSTVWVWNCRSISIYLTDRFYRTGAIGSIPTYLTSISDAEKQVQWDLLGQGRQIAYRCLFFQHCVQTSAILVGY